MNAKIYLILLNKQKTKQNEYFYFDQTLCHLIFFKKSQNIFTSKQVHEGLSENNNKKAFILKLSSFCFSSISGTRAHAHTHTHT